MSAAMLTKKQAAQILGISTRTLDRYRSVGVDFGAKKYGEKTVRFSLKRIMELAESGFSLMI